MSTLKEVAKHCGVSYSSVSRAFDAKSRVGAETRKRILDYAAEINYKPNLIARSLKKSESKTVGIIIPSIENMFYIEALQRFEIALKKFGYRLLVSFVQNGVNTERDCLELMSASQVDAIIISPQDRTNSEYIFKMAAESRLFQLFNAPYSEIDSLVMNDIEGAAIGTRYLLNRGHRHILYLGADERISGFTNTLKEYGIPPDEVCILPQSASIGQVSATIRDFQPTAIFAIALTAESAWNVTRSLNYSIPDDISLIVYDNTKWISMLGITAIAHNLENIANTMVEQVIFRLRNPRSAQEVVRHIVLEPFIIERQSVKIIDK